MVRVDRALEEAGLQAKLILQVHDELIVECPPEEAEQVRAIVTGQMESVAQLSVPLVAQAGGEVLGYVGSQSVMGEADMMNLAVLPAARRRGIARALVTALIRELAGGGVHSLTLEVRASNEAAIGLYDKLGFVAVGRRRGYYEKPREDACILRKEWNL